MIRKGPDQKAGEDPDKGEESNHTDKIEKGVKEGQSHDRVGSCINKLSYQPGKPVKIVPQARFGIVIGMVEDADRSPLADNADRSQQL